MATLGDFPVAAVLRAENLAGAATFFTEVLGLKATEPAGPTSEGMFTAGDGSMAMIYERPGMPAPENTTLGFGVPAGEFDAVIADLRAKGMAFEDYDLPDIGLKTVDGMAEFEGTKVVWFKDSEGNIVNVATM